MSNRNKAIEILKAGRDALLERIVESVIDNEDGFNEKFTNDWCSGDDVLELGERLWRMSRLLEVMPPEKEEKNDKVGFSNPYDAYCSSMSVDASLPLATWDAFISQVQAGDLNGASLTLAALAQVNLDIAKVATSVFAQQQSHEGFRAKARSLRAQLCANRNGSLTLIRELFGITGPVAERVYESLKVAV